MKLKDFTKRITGISTPIGGVSWVPGTDERQIVYRLIQALSDRRLIRHCHGGFEYASVVRSLDLMRTSVAEALGELSPESGSRVYLENIRKALHLFQDFVESEYPRTKYRYGAEAIEPEAPPTNGVLKGLSQMKHIIWQNLEQLGKMYGVQLNADLKENFLDESA